jgi:hypothetical protein
LEADASPFLDRERDKAIINGRNDFTPRSRFDACQITRSGYLSVNRSIERGGPSAVGKSGTQRDAEYERASFAQSNRKILGAGPLDARSYNYF